MLAPSITWILVGSGALTAAGGLAALLFPEPLLRVTFQIESADGATVFFVRHWGVLIVVIGALIVYVGYVPAARTPILTAAAIEKLAFGGLTFFGRVKHSPMLAAGALMDGVFAILYVTYLAGL
jgi:hypothetical protein